MASFYSTARFLLLLTVTIYIAHAPRINLLLHSCITMIMTPQYLRMMMISLLNGNRAQRVTQTLYIDTSYYYLCPYITRIYSELLAFAPL